MASVPIPAPSSSGFVVPGMLRDFLLPVLALLAGIFLPSVWVIYAFVVVGQAHFLMTLLYQHRAGKMNARYLGVVLLLAVGAFLYLYLLGEQPAWMLLAVALLFSAHFAVDEFTLHGERMTARQAITAGLFVLVSFAVVLDEVFPGSLARLALYTLILLFISGAAARLLFARASVSRAERYLWCVGAVTVLLFALGRPEQALSLLIILHCANWAIAYAKRVEGNVFESRRYWLLTLATNAASLLMFYAYLVFHTEYLRYFFLLFYYDAWAIAHVVLSYLFRKR